MTEHIWSGRTSSYEHKRNDWKEVPLPEKIKGSGFKQWWVLNAQWTDCPVEVENQVKDIWQTLEYGNDNFYYKTSLSDLIDLSEEAGTVRAWDDVLCKRIEKPFDVTAITKWVKEQRPEMKDDEEFLIHWWW